jgi:drug/metabolite transporter (DMT)-like permease
MPPAPLQKSNPEATVALVGAAFAVTAWGASGVIIKHISLSSSEIAVYRFAFYSSLLAIVMAVKGTPLTIRALRVSIWGGLALGLDVACFFEALKRTTIVNATIIGSLQPIIVSIYGYKVLGEKIRTREIGIGLVALLGTVGVLVGSIDSAEWNITGDLLSVGALFSWSAYFILSKQTQDRVTPMEYTASTAAITGIMNFLVALILGISFTVPSRENLLWLLLLAAIAGVIGHSLMNWSLVRIPLWVGSIFTLFVPVAAASLGWIFLGESLNTLQVLSTVVVILALGSILRYQR